MNPLIERLTGMQSLTDQVVAMDLLINAKSSIRNVAMAVTETQNPEIKHALTTDLEESLDLHEKVTTYMLEKGWISPQDLNKQIDMDLQTIQTALKLPTL